MTHHANGVTSLLYLKIGKLAQNANQAVFSEQVLTAFDGITKVNFSAAYGRITIYYDKDLISLDHVLLLLATLGFRRRKCATRSLIASPLRSLHS